MRLVLIGFAQVSLLIRFVQVSLHLHQSRWICTSLVTHWICTSLVAHCICTGLVTHGICASLVGFVQVSLLIGFVQVSLYLHKSRWICTSLVCTSLVWHNVWIALGEVRNLPHPQVRQPHIYIHILCICRCTGMFIHHIRTYATPPTPKGMVVICTDIYIYIDTYVQKYGYVYTSYV